MCEEGFDEMPIELDSIKIPMPYFFDNDLSADEKCLIGLLYTLSEFYKNNEYETKRECVCKILNFNEKNILKF